jgi:hypothetical protein
MIDFFFFYCIFLHNQTKTKLDIHTATSTARKSKPEQNKKANPFEKKPIFVQTYGNLLVELV